MPEIELFIIIKYVNINLSVWKIEQVDEKVV